MDGRNKRVVGEVKESETEREREREILLHQGEQQCVRGVRGKQT